MQHPVFGSARVGACQCVLVAMGVSLERMQEIAAVVRLTPLPNRLDLN